MVTDQQVRKYMKLKKTEDGKGRKGRKGRKAWPLAFSRA
jgi:hypothetical protein